MKSIKTISLLLLMVFSTCFVKAQQPATTNIDKIASAYLAVKDALTVDNGTVAESKAKDLLAALSNQPDKGLNLGQQKLLAGYIEKLKFDSRHISETNVIDHQREHFASLSKNLFEVLSGLKMTTITLYEQYCPMKKAYWLSQSAAIKNPYYGKEMQTCGRTTFTIAAVK